MFYVYILEHSQGGFYVGQTDDVDRRLAEPNDPTHNASKYTTRNKCPWVLVRDETFATRADAMRREKFIKSRKPAPWIRQHLLGRWNESRCTSGLTARFLVEDPLEADSNSSREG